MSEIALYTDGSISGHVGKGKQGTGGIGFHFLDEQGNAIEISAGPFEPAISSNVMETLSIVQGLKAVFVEHGPSKVRVISDSKTAIGWSRTAQLGEVIKAHSFLSEPLQKAIRSHENVVFEHVKGHSKNEGNILADELAGRWRSSDNEPVSIYEFLGISERDIEQQATSAPPTDGREARLLRDFESVRTYIKRIGLRYAGERMSEEDWKLEKARREYEEATEGVSSSKSSLFIVWRGNRTAIVYEGGGGYHKEVGELRWRSNYERDDPISRNNKNAKPEDARWVLEPTPYACKNAMTIEEVRQFKTEDDIFREPNYKPIQIEESSNNLEYELLTYLELHNLPDVISDAEPNNIFIYWRFEGQRTKGKKYPPKLLECIRIRSYKENGTKKFLTLYPLEGNSWGAGEPEDFHRLYGIGALQMATSAKRLFIHEGESTLDKVLNKIHKHEIPSPINELLASDDNLHIGWGFGALNPSRVNWQRIRGLCNRLKINQVIICPDADQDGYSAIRTISEAFCDSEFDVMYFDVESMNVPEKWDFGDDIPEENWKFVDGHRVWLNSNPEIMLRDANWCTTIIGYSDNMAPIYGPTKKMMKNIYKVEGSNLFVSKATPYMVLPEGAMRDNLLRFSNTGELMEMFKRENMKPVHSLAFRPDQQTGRFWDKDKSIHRFNTYVDRKPMSIQGDVSIFYEYMEWMIGNENERQCTIEWVASCINQPQIRVNHALVLFSRTEGVGKSTLFYIIAKCLGEFYSREVSANTLTKSTFNGFVENILFLMCHEIYEEGDYNAVNKLKTLITEKQIEINRKNIEAYIADVCCWIGLASNSEAALALNDVSRRFLVVHCIEKKLENAPNNLKNRLFEWLNSGIAESSLRWHFQNEFGKAEGYQKYRFLPPRMDAPDTAAKKEMARNSKSAYIEEIEEALDSLSGDATTLREIKLLLKSTGARKSIRDSLVLNAVVNHGFHHGPCLDEEGNDCKMNIRYLIEEGTNDQINERFFRTKTVLIHKEELPELHDTSALDFAIENGTLSIVHCNGLRRRLGLPTNPHASGDPKVVPFQTTPKGAKKRPN